MTTPLLLIRHAPTIWNGEKRLQGHTDIPISDLSKNWVKEWRLPEFTETFQWISSPLSRALETAEILSGKTPPTDKRLIEMSFGDWEGKVLPDLRERLGTEMQENEDRGLDFLPPNGESPRQVQNRINPLLQEIAKHDQATVCVTHLAMIRAIMALACDWPMLGKPPYKLNQAEAHLFELDHNGHPSIVEMNIKLHPGPNPNKEQGI
ncbi:histidine phosphatase family protein [Curvivirga sp.]|uniref:histidine phosphatase family protein n=1 Tax=Curvivirga sp. TaxID=2856848 RepID=UPI003B5C0987